MDEERLKLKGSTHYYLATFYKLVVDPSNYEVESKIFVISVFIFLLNYYFK